MSDNPDWEINCSPSYHANRKGQTNKDVIDEFVETCTKNSKYALEMVTKYELDIPYGEGSSEKLDVFYPKTYTEETNIAVFFPGGYWQEGSKELYHYLAYSVTESSNLLVFVGTDLAPKGTITSIVQQCREAVGCVCKMFPNAERVTFFGHSAGGMEVAILASTPWESFNPSVAKYFKSRQIRLVMLSGIYELTHLIDTTYNVPLKMNVEEATKHSPVNQVKELASNQKLYDFKIAIVEVGNEAPTIKKCNSDYIKVLAQAKVHFFHKMLEISDHFKMIENMFDPENCLTKICTEDSW